MKYWRDKLTNVQYANIGSQVKFIDTINCINQSLSSLAKSADENEKTNIRLSCQKFIKTNSIHSVVFNSHSDKNKRVDS